MIMQEMAALRIDVFFHQQSIDTTTAAGKLCFQIFASLAEWEREMIRERVIAGIATARRKGVKLGRPSKMNDSLKAAIVLLRSKGTSIKQIAAQLQVGIGTVYKSLEHQPD
jgi:DNA invertase Pin-like site-specific DNA recombinase